MEKARWALINKHLDYALTLLPEERKLYLDEVCLDDIELCSKVKSLLKHADDNKKSPLFEPFVYSGKSIDLEKDIGNYSPVRVLGQGGMGIVYLAEDKPNERLVALKILKRGMSSDTAILRFKHERRILAQLEHPNIARLYGSHITEEGNPYFAMEYVDGKDILAYCDENKLTIEERLRLFLSVCDAVEHAHKNVVVHRDIKPSNILVTTERWVKLLDFGIAKLLDVDSADYSTQNTIQGMQPMTPEYASPEQVKGDTPSTNIDVYSLGIVLYELLSGHHPYRLAGMSWEEARNTILYYEPTPPSKAIKKTKSIAKQDGRETTTSATEISTLRSTNADRLKNTLRGDLDHIVMKALQKDPSDRYAFVSNLSDDIRLYLSNKPIKARPDRFIYKTQKFIRRHRITSAAIVLAIFAILYHITEIRKERDTAEDALVKAEEVTEFLVGVFGLSDGYTGKADSLTARQILDRGAKQIQEEVNVQPEIKAEMMEVIGSIYNNLALYDESIDLLEESLEIREDLYNNNNLDIAASLFELGRTHWRKGNYSLADSLLSESLDIQSSFVRKDDILVAKTKNELANVYLAKGLPRESEEYYKDAHDIFQQNIAEYGKEYAIVLTGLGSIYFLKGDLDEAANHLKKSIAHFRSLPGNNNADLGTALHSYAYVLVEMNSREEAEQNQREVLTLWKKEFPANHPSIAIALKNLANIRASLENYNEAHEMYLEAYELLRSRLGESHEQTVIALADLGISFRNIADLPNSSIALTEAVQHLKQIHGEQHPFIAKFNFHLAITHEKLENLSSADSLYRTSLEMRRNLLDPKHTSLAFSLANYGVFLANNGRTEESDSLLIEALDIQQEVYPEGDWRIAQTLGYLGNSYIKQRKYEQAKSILQESFRMLEASQTRPHYAWKATVNYLVELHQALNETQKAADFKRLLLEN